MTHLLPPHSESPLNTAAAAPLSPPDGAPSSPRGNAGGSESPRQENAATMQGAVGEDAELFTRLFPNTGASSVDGPDRHAKPASQPETRPAPGKVGDGSVAPGAGWFTAAYGAAALIGILPTFVSHQLWFIPMLALIVYVLAGYKKAAETATTFEFADSVYYLGFTLSVGSLLASLEPFNTVKQPDPEKIFHYFGLGLLTTLVGVVARTMLQTYHRLPQETFEEVNRRVTAEAHVYLESLERLHAQVLRTATATATRLEEGVLPRLIVMEQALATSVEHLEATNAATSKLATQATVVNQALLDVETRYTESAARVVTATDSAATAAGDLATRLTSAATTTETKANQMTTGLAGVTQHATALREALDALEARVAGVQIDAALFTQPLAAVSTSLATADEAVQREVNALAIAVAAYRQNAQNAREASLALADPTFGQALKSLSDELTKLQEAVASQRTMTTTELATMRTQVSEVLAAARDMTAALDEIANAAMRRLTHLGGSNTGSSDKPVGDGGTR